MRIKLNILRFNRQKIPSMIEFCPQNFTIPRKTYISRHFHLKANTINDNQLTRCIIMH